ncbi:MAG TPA: dephospho-CoA kinase [Candidatus Dormibacteraeota bacterium]|nr:dephospho-CoA kinase [Candidatus Dormibacteraeota bacterium]
MKLVGLTGGIGTGKSTVAAMLRAKGVCVVDADEATRAVQVPGSEGLDRIVEAFGPDLLTPSGELDRARLASIVFKDPRARQRLNAIVHPLVRAWMAERVREAAGRGEPVVVLDIPLLYESRGEEGLDAVIVVYAPPELQLRRLVELRGMSEAEARERIAAQMPIDEKRRRARYVIVNTGDLDQLRAEVERVWGQVTAGPPAADDPFSARPEDRG